jgi:tetratricopeptide (TPR) repeat protein
MLVRGVIGALVAGAPEPERPRRRFRFGWAAAAIVATSVSAGAVAAVAVVRAFEPQPARAPAQASDPSAVRAARPGARPAVGGRPSAPPAGLAEPPRAAEAPPPEPRAHQRPSGPPLAAPRRLPRAVPEARAPRPDALAAANELRAARRYVEAEAAYAAIAAGAPDSREAYVATLARAGLFLGPLGRPAAALALYGRALAQAPAGALADEALFGIAECHRALGDARGERAALQDLLARRPDSPWRRRALGRLRELPP